MSDPDEIARRRDEFAHQITALEEGVTAARAHISMLEIEHHTKSREFSAKLKGAVNECDDIRHRLNSIRVGILGLYDETEPGKVDKRGNPK